jgi:ribosomal protein S13
MIFSNKLEFKEKVSITLTILIILAYTLIMCSNYNNAKSIERLKENEIEKLKNLIEEHIVEIIIGSLKEKKRQYIYSVSTKDELQIFGKQGFKAKTESPSSHSGPIFESILKKLKR